MGWQYVLVNAYVPDVSGGAPPPLGIWGGGNVPMPSPPIANVPGAPGYNPPGPPLGIWGPNDPRPNPPIYFPPQWGGEQPPQIWGPNDPRPTPPIYLPPTPGQPPQIWGPTDPRPTVPIYLPPGYGRPPLGTWGGGNVPMPTPPIANVPGAPGWSPPLGIWGPTDPFPTPPIYMPPEWPPLPIIPPEEDRPEHPEVPDLNAGNWLYVTDGQSYKLAFVPWPLAVTHPDYNPNYPPENTQPGTWVTVVYGGTVAWAWVPSTSSDTGSGGDEQ